MGLVWIFLITVVILQGSVLLTTVYLHRYVTHRGYRLHPLVGNLMHAYLTIFTGVIPKEWAAVHRKHHQFSDHEGDPHSPKVYGLWHVLLGNYFYYKRETQNSETITKYTPDYKADWVDRIPGVRYGVWAGLVVFLLMFGWLAGLIAWASHLVTYVLLNSMVNSLGHEVGYKNFDNEATNIPSLAYVTGGEGLHNNHHQFPTSACLAMRKGEWDPGWVLIRGLERLEWAAVSRPLPYEKTAH